MPVPMSAGSHPIQARLKGYKPAQALCQVSQSDVDAKQARCTVALRAKHKAQPRKGKSAGKKPKKDKPKGKPKIHMID